MNQTTLMQRTEGTQGSVEIDIARAQVSVLPPPRIQSYAYALPRFCMPLASPATGGTRAPVNEDEDM
jgi:hypothetical protein